MAIVTYMNAIRDGIAEEMRRDPNIIIMGEGIGKRGGSYGHTKNLWNEFGPERVIDTPISENGFAGMAVGAAICGLKPIIDIMFADIVYEIMSQICQQASKMCYMSNGKISVPIVVRAQIGARSTGPHHSACLYPLFMHIPGFKVVAPSNPYDAKGLIKAAIRDENPVMFFEHKFAYMEKGEIPEDEYIVPIGKAKVVREGTDITIVAVSTMVNRLIKMIEKGIISADAEIIDPRSLWPIDMKTIIDSIKKTGRLIIIEEAHYNCNAGAEITSRVIEEAFDCLRAPVLRVATDNVPHPYSEVLESAMMVNEEKIKNAVNRVMSYKT